MKIEKICDNCGGTDLRFDATVIWDTDQQEFVVDDIRDAYCWDCECEVFYREIPLNTNDSVD